MGPVYQTGEEMTQFGGGTSKWELKLVKGEGREGKSGSSDQGCAADRLY